MLTLPLKESVTPGRKTQAISLAAPVWNRDLHAREKQTSGQPEETLSLIAAGSVPIGKKSP